MEACIYCLAELLSEQYTVQTHDPAPVTTGVIRYFRCRESERQHEIAQLEARVYRLAELLSEQRAATRDNVQRKQARTGGERDEDDDAVAGEPTSDDSDVDDDNDVPYNPKNLPLGWDGKVGTGMTSQLTTLESCMGT